MISTSKQHAKHMIADRATQQLKNVVHLFTVYFTALKSAALFTKGFPPTVLKSKPNSPLILLQAYTFYNLMKRKKVGFLPLFFSLLFFDISCEAHKFWAIAVPFQSPTPFKPD